MKRILLFLSGISALISLHAQSIRLDPRFGNNGVVQTYVNQNVTDESVIKIRQYSDVRLITLFKSGDMYWLGGYMQNGMPDLTFAESDNGYAMIFQYAFTPVDMAIQKDGKILVAGTQLIYGTQPGAFSVVRLSSNGYTDFGFGDCCGGQATTAVGENATVAALALQPDGKIVVAGTAVVGGQADFAFVRYNADGFLDKSFSEDGILTIDLGSAKDSAQDVVVQPDGKIVVGGYTGNGRKNFALVRVNPDGSLDRSFSGDGKLTTNFKGGDDILTSLALQGDGKIIAGGYTVKKDSDFVLARYTTTGVLDKSFADNGKVIIDFFQRSQDVLKSVAIQNDGKIVIGGYTRWLNGYDFAVMKFLSNGAPDLSFGLFGRMVVNFGLQDRANDMILQQDGKIVLAGETRTGTTLDIAIARINTNGLPDFSFNGNGKIIDVLRGSSFYNSLALQSNGKIVAGGGTRDVFFYTALNDYAIGRYQTNGKLDPAFSTDGIQNLHFDYAFDAFIKKIAVLPDNKILVAGEVTATDSKGIGDFELSRFYPDGRLDSTFGTNGKVLTDLGGEEFLTGLAVQPDGKIVISGYSVDYNGNNSFHLYVLRYLSNGVLDPAFGSGGLKEIPAGLVETNEPIVAPLLLQPDGKIVVSGLTIVSSDTAGSNLELLVARMNTDGSMDPGFGTGGIKIINTLPSGNAAFIRDIALQPDGKILLAGGIQTGIIVSNEFLVIRLNADGSLDPGFSSDGWIITRFTPTSSDIANALVLQGDGRIILGGSSNGNLAMARYTSYGELDPSFGNAGLKTFDVSPGNDEIRDLLLSGNHLYAAGVSKQRGPIATVVSFILDNGYITYYRDEDGDGYGDPYRFITASSCPAGYVTDHTDCNDHNSHVHPHASEILSNGLDDNCNGVADENPYVMNGAASKQALNDSLIVDVLPNPSVQQFTLRLSSSLPELLSVRITDVSGQVIEKREGVAANGNIILGNTYKPGVYFAEIIQGSKRKVIKLIKQTQ